jgi:hypothetical protein
MKTSYDYYSDLTLIIGYLDHLQSNIGLTVQRLKQYHESEPNKEHVIVFFPVERQHYIGPLPDTINDGIILCRILAGEKIKDWKDVEEDLYYDIKELIDYYRDLRLEI